MAGENDKVIEEEEEMPVLGVDDLMTIIAEQTVELRVVKHLRRNLEAEVARLRGELANYRREESDGTA